MNMIAKMSFAGVVAAAFGVSAMACPPDASATHKVSVKTAETCKLSKVAKKDGSCNATKLSQVAKKDGPCNASKKASLLVKAEGKQCPVSVAMKALPAMTYQVGAEKTSCSVTAGKWAAEHDEATAYVVAGKTYKTAQLAKVAHVEATEQFVNGLVDSHKCPVSGKTFVGKKSYQCPVSAGHIAKAGKEAMEKVVITYKVGTKEICCPDMAKDFAKSAKKPVTFVVGNEETSCNVTARMNLAKAKYAAGVKAILAAEAQEEAKAEKISKAG